jgi:hypothetical protein
VIVTKMRLSARQPEMPLFKKNWLAVTRIRRTRIGERGV